MDYFSSRCAPNPANILIDAAQLEKLTFFWGSFSFDDSINLPNFETIRFIECSAFDKRLQFTKFVNLETLLCVSISPEFDLANYPKLRKIDLYPCPNDAHIVESLVRQRNELAQHRNLEISVCGISGASDIPLESGLFSCYLSLHAGDLDTLKSRCSNLESFVSFPGPVKLHLEEPNGEFGKLSRYFAILNIKEVSVRHLTTSSSTHFINFLRNINGVHHLLILNCSPIQTFFDALPSVAYMHKLYIYSDTMTHLDYEFLSKIRFLNKIDLMLNHHKFRIDSLCKIIVDSKFDKFRIVNKFFEINSHSAFHEIDNDPNRRLEVFDGTEYWRSLFTRSIETIEEVRLFLKTNPETKGGLDLNEIFVL